jgi:dihydrolipoamide dehydrogenase
MNDTYDVIVLGAGPGGYPCAIRLAQLGKKVLVVEAKYLGGLCLNWGCIPTKALSYAAEMTDNFKKAKKLGFTTPDDGCNITTLRNWKEGVIKRLRAGIEYLFKEHGIYWKQGRARISSEHEVEIEHDGKKEVCRADTIVIATGTEVAPLPGFTFDGQHVIDTDEALEIQGIPKNLLIIGAGVSGLEMAVIYSRLGSSVTVVEIMKQILPGMEHEMCEHLCKILHKSGIEIYVNSQVISYTRKDNQLETAIKTPDTQLQRTFDKMLVAVGRRPVKYAFQDVAITTDKKGYIIIDETLRTSIKNIFAIGDVVGPPLLAHKATRQGIVCAEIISGAAGRLQSQPIPSCVFTIPPLSSVGLTENEARAQGYNVKIGRFPYRASGKALAMAETEGFVKIIGDEKGRLIGIHILGAESPSLIGEAVLALDKGLLVEDLACVIHPHPTLTETIQEAAENFYKKAIHVVNK